jgi:hypothetical protein
MKAINCPHKDRKNAGYGLCPSCYSKMKYNFDEKHRNRILELSKKYYKERYEKNPNWNRDKQREYRKKSGNKYNYILAKCYMRRLDKTSIKKLLREIGFYSKRR